tara:strand:- start:4988 stop:5719 length:732 start_codon:yes stop_codon:yes gene_type:complete
MQKVIIIPSRLASVRLPNKPLVDIGGTPMVVRVARQAQKATADKVMIACCGEEIKSAIEAIGSTAVITDPSLPSGTDRVHAAAQSLSSLGPNDIVVNLQGDLPFINPQHITQVIDLLEQRPEFDLTTLAAPITDKSEINNPSVVKVAFSPLGPDQIYGYGHYFSRAAVPHGANTFYHHIGLYAFRKAALDRFVKASPTLLETTEKLEQLRALDIGLKIGVGIVDEPPISIDTPEDLEKARQHV